MPKLPRLPKLPPSPIKPLRGIMQGGRQQVEKARDDIRSIADDLHGSTGDLFRGTTPSKTPPRERKEESPVSIKEGAETGTACITCSDEHFSMVSGFLGEAVRFAQNEGIDSKEVIRRIRHSRDELNAMERFDLASDEIVKLPEIEKPVAHWSVPQSRNLRHMISSIKSFDDLEKTAALAAEVADEFQRKTLELQKYYQGQIKPDIADLREWLEERTKHGK